MVKELIRVMNVNQLELMTRIGVVEIANGMIFLRYAGEILMMVMMDQTFKPVAIDIEYA